MPPIHVNLIAGVLPFGFLFALHFRDLFSVADRLQREIAPARGDNERDGGKSKESGK